MRLPKDREPYSTSMVSQCPIRDLKDGLAVGDIYMRCSHILSFLLDISKDEISIDTEFLTKGCYLIQILVRR